MFQGRKLTRKEKELVETEYMAAKKRCQQQLKVETPVLACLCQRYTVNRNCIYILVWNLNNMKQHASKMYLKKARRILRAHCADVQGLGWLGEPPLSCREGSEESGPGPMGLSVAQQRVFYLPEMWNKMTNMYNVVQLWGSEADLVWRRWREIIEGYNMIYCNYSCLK